MWPLVAHFNKETVHLRPKKFYFLAFIIVVSILFLLTSTTFLDQRKGYAHVYRRTIWNKDQVYLINTSMCRIPNLDPLNDDVLPFFKPRKYTECSKKMLLTHIIYTVDGAFLHLNLSLIPEYSWFSKVYCCYSVISRVASQDENDNLLEFSECRSFEISTEIHDEVIKVSCRNQLGMPLYTNFHSIILKKKSEEKTGKVEDETQKGFNVILFGIDSISITNLIRTMPRTYELLETSFVPLHGYTKIGMNTFPNLVGILTGQTSNQFWAKCDSESLLDNCSFIWDTFKENGYKTAYAEDETSINTFTFLKKGFFRPPTDYYFRPYFIAAETLSGVILNNLRFCTGPENTGQRIMNLIQDYLKVLKGDLKFGLFWSNSFSHEDINTASQMDLKIYEFLSEVQKLLDNTFLMFLSDHGFRFGDYRTTYSGWLEERIPYFYISVPKRFRKEFPQKYENLLVNSKRLTTAFDIHMTLQEILVLANQSYTVTPSLGCPKCQSLFEPVPENRSCSDAAIESQWCVCSGYLKLNPHLDILKSSALFIVSKLNRLLAESKFSKLCAKYELKNVIFGAKATNNLDNFENTFIIMLTTEPYAIFEGTVKIIWSTDSHQFNEYELINDIRRIDRYGNKGNCVNDSTIRTYCYCKTLLIYLTNGYCSYCKFFKY